MTGVAHPTHDERVSSRLILDEENVVRLAGIKTLEMSEYEEIIS
jgi:hypothetical protein